MTYSQEHLDFLQHTHSRHEGLLTTDEQQMLRNKRILIAGCGVGSLIAISAVRIGFDNFVLVDGDTVELSNINRQGYGASDVGKFKVDALAERMRHINPHAQIETHSIFLDVENVGDFVSKADIIIDAIDPEASIVEIALHRVARSANKYIIQPSDIGWGALLHIFSGESATYEELLGYTSETPLEQISPEEVLGRIVEHYLQFMPPYAQAVTMQFVEGKIAKFPQPVSAAYIVAALAVVAMKRIALGLPVKVAPEFVSFDPNEMLTPGN